MGTFDGEFGGEDDGDELFVLLRAGVGGACIGWTLTLHSFEWRLGKLNVFVHCDKLRTILDFENVKPVKSRFYSNLSLFFSQIH